MLFRNMYHTTVKMLNLPKMSPYYFWHISHHTSLSKFPTHLYLGNFCAKFFAGWKLCARAVLPKHPRPSRGPGSTPSSAEPRAADARRLRARGGPRLLLLLHGHRPRRLERQPGRARGRGAGHGDGGSGAQQSGDPPPGGQFARPLSGARQHTWRQ